MADRRGHKKAPSLFLDFENLPGPAKHSVLMHLRVFDWYQTRQVSKAWMTAVDLEVRHLAEGSNLPRDLAPRFPGLRTLDLEYCDHRVSARQLTHALLNLPRLQALLNVYDLDWVSLLLGRKSASDCAKRARLSVGMTSLSFGELLDPYQCKLPRDLANIAKEWSNLRSIWLPHRLSGTRDMLALLKPLRASLQSLDLQTTCSLATAMRDLGFANLLSTKNSQDLLVLQHGLGITSAEHNSFMNLVCQCSSRLTELSIERGGRRTEHLCYLALSTLSSYTNLMKLSISGPFSMTYRGAQCLTRLQKLTALTLASSRVKPFQIQMLSALTKLNCLEVPTCPFATLEEFEEVVGTFTSLKELNAGGGYLGEWVWPMAAGLTSLTSFCYGVIGDMPSLRNLQRLHLDIISCADEVAQLIGTDCQQVTYLHIDFRGQASFRDDNIQSLARLEKLQYLGLTHCRQLTSAGLAHLAPLSRLGFLNLSQCSPCILQSSTEDLPLAHLPLQWLSLAGVESTSLPLKLRPAFQRALSTRVDFDVVPSPEGVHWLCMTAGEAACGAEAEYQLRPRQHFGFINPM